MKRVLLLLMLIVASLATARDHSVRKLYLRDMHANGRDTIAIHDTVSFLKQIRVHQGIRFPDGTIQITAGGVGGDTTGMLKRIDTLWIVTEDELAGYATAGHNHSGIYLPVADTAGNLKRVDTVWIVTEDELAGYATAGHTHSTYIPYADTSLAWFVTQANLNSLLALKMAYGDTALAWFVTRSTLNGLLGAKADTTDNATRMYVGLYAQPLNADLTDLADGTLTGSKVQTFGTSNVGAVPASGGGTTNYLRADGAWAEPPGGSGVSADSVKKWISDSLGTIAEFDTTDAAGKTSTTGKLWYDPSDGKVKVATDQNSGGTLTKDTVAAMIRDTLAAHAYLEKRDTVLLYSAAIGLGMPTDTALFRQGYLLPSLDNYGNDTLVITRIAGTVHGTSPDVDVKFRFDANEYDATPTEVNSTALTVTSTTTGSSTTTLANPKVPPDVFLWPALTETATQPTNLQLRAWGYRVPVAPSPGIALDHIDTAAVSDHASPHEITATIGSGSNKYAVLGVAGFTFAAGTIDSVTVDVGGGSFERCDSIRATASTVLFAALFGKTNLSAGTHTFRVYTSVNATFRMGVVSLTGVDQTNPITTSAIYAASSVSASVTISNTLPDWTIGTVGNANSKAYGQASPEIPVFYGAMEAMSYLTTAETSIDWTTALSASHRAAACVVNAAE